MDFVLPCDVPIVQAPMAGGPSTPELTAAVAAAGGYGFVAGGYLTADALRRAISRTRELTRASFGVNLFVPSSPPSETAADAAIAGYAQTLRDEAARLGVELGKPHWEDDDYAAKLDVVLTSGVHCVSFTFGCPSEQTVDQLHGSGSLVAVTVTSSAEAEAASGVAADAIVVQGTEAGGHQGSFGADEPNISALRDLLRAVGTATKLPAIASGGIMTSADVRAALDAGAVAVQVGTALLCAQEAGTSAVHRRALLEARYDDTVITRAYTGRYARGLRNRFATEHTDAPAAYPQVHHLTRPLRAAATVQGDPEVPNLWAGTGWRGVTAAPAAEIIRSLSGDQPG